MESSTATAQHGKAKARTGKARAARAEHSVWMPDVSRLTDEQKVAVGGLIVGAITLALIVARFWINKELPPPPPAPV